MKNRLKIGLFGFGTVGQGFYHVLCESKGFDADIVRICVKHEEKPRSLSKEFFTFCKDDILCDPEISLVVELIDDADEAYTIVKTAMNNGKSVVSANKKMLAYNIREFIDIQHRTGKSLLYEASACGSIPIIRNLEEYYDNNLLQSVSGIMNGSSNYILSKIFNENMDYNEALTQAQELGFAESNPAFDVEGLDTLYKLVIIAVHSFGVITDPDKVFNYGISGISSFDKKYALEKGYKIKLIGQVLKSGEDHITLFVMPMLVSPDSNVYNVEDQFNGVVLEGLFYDEQFMFGKGAGGNPAGSAVFSDITARMHDYRYEYKKMKYHKKLHYTDNVDLEIYLRYKNEDDINCFEFHNISERYAGKDNKYITGTISLKNLIKNKSYLNKAGIFIAYYGINKSSAN